MPTDPTTTATTRTPRALRLDLAWRALVPVAAVVALALPGPRAVAGVLALAALALAAERLVRLRSTAAADRVLVGIGGAMVVVVLLGMVLGSTEIGLRQQTWVVGLAATSLVGLVVAALLPARTPDPAVPTGPAGLRPAGGTRRTAALLVPWLAVSVVVVAVSVQVSADSLASTDRQPLQMGFGRVSGTEVEVVISSSDPVGPLELRASADGNDVSYPLVSLDRDGSTTTTIDLPRSGRYVITLNYPDQTKPLRSLVLAR